MKTFKVPAKILYEENSIKYFEELKSKKVFIVTDKIMFELGMTKKVEEILDKALIKYEIFCEVEPEPTMEVVTNAIEIFRSEECLVGKECIFRWSHYHYKKLFL